MESRIYPTDLSDDEWRCIRPHLPEHSRRGRPRLHSLRAILDAVFYVLKSGCPWRLLPREFPPWKTVYDWFRRWRIDGTWERLNAQLRERLRVRSGREPNPSAAIVDSQTAKTTGVGGNERGFDPAKGVEGRKRHLLVDTEGFVLKAKVHSAKVMDYEGIKPLLRKANECFPRLSHLWLDAGYRGEDKGADWVQKTLGWIVDLVERPKKPAPEKVMMAWALGSGPKRGWPWIGKSCCLPKASWYCLVAGLWSERSLGSSRTGGWAKTTRGCVLAVRRWCTLP
jgi:putative transposase